MKTIMMLLWLLVVASLAGGVAGEGLDQVEVAVQTDGDSSSPPLVLKYWDGRGLMEVSRMILAIAGKFPGDYEDGRFSSPPEGLKSNLGRMPVLSVASADIGQSVAIHFYLATEHDLMGDSSLEAAKILSIGEHIREMSSAYRVLVPYGEEPSDEVTSKWFDEGATDVLGTADYSKMSVRYLSWWMGRIEQALDAEGFAVGNRLSLADVYVYNAFHEILREEETATENFPRWRAEPFGSADRMMKKLAIYPRLAASCNAVSKNVNIQRWLSMRGKQSF